ncbi:UPF0149 family protein [Pseudomonas sp. HR96]|uniref:UPF0149 family protein n=1 Tax=Pseudomonas sp. HR96 TaxID=1027966 RepID=UPI002A751B84|nr:UPF0149 family protein [Pseudomonas sp. HR96]WPP00980.1 UPF0149 family protein [Pseudomonas sp. HR96]
MAYTISNKPLTHDDFVYLQDQLEKHATGHSIAGVSEMDGFFAAVMSCAEVIAFDRWYPAFWGGPELLPKWTSERDFQRFFDLLVQHMNQIAMLMADYPDDYSPIFNLADDDETLDVVDWCLGYERGVALDGGWTELPEQQGLLHALIVMQTLEYTEAEADNPLAGQDPAQLIRYAALGLHEYWSQQREEEVPELQPVRVDTKVGRNDPCPCGSGRKFKQCCMGAASS